MNLTTSMLNARESCIIGRVIDWEMTSPSIRIHLQYIETWIVVKLMGDTHRPRSRHKMNDDEYS